MFPLLVGLVFATRCEAVYPTPDLDITTSIFGRTVFIEYVALNFIGKWIGHDESYNATLHSVRNEDLYDPAEKSRLQVEDCGDGYACLKTRWNELEDNDGWYLSDRHDVVTFRERGAEDDDLDYSKWRIFCLDNTARDFCYICDYYFSWLYDMDNCLLGELPDYTLNSDFDSLYEFPDQVFKFKVKVPVAEDEGYVPAAESVCNTGGEPVLADLDYLVGISNTLLEPWDHSQTISDEVQYSFSVDLPDTPWTLEIETGTTFQQESSASIQVEIPANQKVVLQQLRGSYGPYLVRGSVLVPEIEEC